MKILPCSMSDFFIEGADKWRNDAWRVIKNSPQHEFQILTKRPERIQQCLPDDWCKENYSNVWLGVTVERQNEVYRIHELAKNKCELRWVSFEPLLGSIYLTKEELASFQWAILGGESGSLTGKYRFRKTELDWYLSLMYQLRDSGTALFFKQLGSWYHHNQFFLKDWKGEKWCRNYPDIFKIRQFPKKLEGGGYGV